MSHTAKAVRLIRIIGFLTVLSLLLGAMVHADGPISPAKDSPADAAVKTSHRLIVELESPPLTRRTTIASQSLTPDGQLDVHSAAAQRYLQQLEAEQNAFTSAMQAALPQANVSTYLNEYGMEESATYQIAFNGIAIDPGETDKETARQALAQLPGVKRVYRDYMYTSDLYTSTHLINAPMTWNLTGGRENAGAGVKVASMDGGIHKDAPMFDGTGYTYPAGYPKGLTTNTNGKIIASRVYFRTWDPPAPGDENPWPGESGTPHGGHTSGIMAGDVVTASYLGLEFPNMSGVAPKAYLMSYRVFYASVSGDGAFYTAEGLAALDDIIADGAEVLNNSWGGGPGSAGGEFDPLDQALINASEAGVFVSMSNGNAGPGLGTGDHPSDDYINVGATTTSGTLASGALNVIAPEPTSPALQDISFGTAEFGAPLPIGEIITHTFATAAAVDPENVTGCAPFPADAFDGVAAVISRGGCFFSDKVRHAQQAGATFVVVYNNAGDDLINMACGDDCSDITISSVFIGQTAGDGMVAWYADHGDASVLELNTLAFQAGNEPDYVASFSSRGPGVGYTLKPDIAAPGVNILSQGYTPGATGEARHFGYGQASGTSMAAPHVAGAAALLRQLYPDWTNADIKSALMSTAKYLGVYNHDGTPAQPLDIGAGRLDVGAATDPGVILDPPSLSFGAMMTGTTKSMMVEVTNVATGTETYDLSTLYTGAGFAPTQTTSLPGFTVSPISITVNPGISTYFTVTFDTAAGQGVGDNQGYILLEGDSGHDAHSPTWARVQPEPAAADVLLLDADASWLLGYPDYLPYYTSTLDNLGLTYEIWTPGYYYGNPATIPEAATLSAYDTIILFTGDHYQPDGTFTVSTPLTMIDMNRLTEYANGGGTIIAMGQDLASVLNSAATDGGEFFYSSVLGGNWLQDSISAYALPSAPVVPLADAPPAFNGISLDLSGPEIYTGMADLLDESVVTFKYYLPIIMKGGSTTQSAAVTSGASEAALYGGASFVYDRASNRLDYLVTIEDIPYPTDVSITINRGPADENGSAAYTLLSETTVETDTLVLEDAVLLETADADHLLNGELYVAVKTTESQPFDALRGQIMVTPVKDGAANQYYVDELATKPFKSPDNPEELLPYTPLLAYAGPYNRQDGVVAMAHRDQPTLEIPGISYFGRSIYTSFGLEGVNGESARANLLQTFFNWAMDEPTVTISNTTPGNASELTTFQANLDSDVTGTTGYHYRWDFGDASDIAGPYRSSQASHVYEDGGIYTVTVEVTDNWGNKTIGSREVLVPDITVLHTNDEHGWLLPNVPFGSPVTEGGVASLMGRLTAHEGYSPDSDNFLLLSSGDNWTGPSISTWFEGEPVVEVMNAMGYDVSVIGNHEFDFGRDVLNQRIAEADFPFLSANIYYSGTTDLADFVTPYIIKEVDGVDVGIVGLSTIKTPQTTHPKNITDLSFGDYEEALRREVPKMRAEGADLIIVEAHVCSEELIPLATDVSDLDIALMEGGHCHETYTGQVGDTLILEGHWAWRAYGKTELVIDPMTYDVVTYTQEVVMNEYVTDEGNPVLPDPEIQDIVEHWEEEVDEEMGEVIGYTETGMPRRSWKQLNYVMDSWLWAYGTADIAMSNWGGFRAGIPAGDITVGDIVGVLPFENRIVDCEITGADVVDNLECCGDVAVAGISYAYHMEDDVRVVDAVTLTNGSPLVITDTYSVLINDFMYAGGDDFLFGDQDPDAYDTGIQWRQPVIDWTIAQNTTEANPIDPLIDDKPRIIEITP